MSQSILIVEDDPAIASTLKFALEREGWQVTWVDTASQVAPILASLERLSAIVMDVGLPDGDGFSLCQSVRFGQHFAQVPILFLTARDDEIDKILGLEMGADDYITKPFSPREIVARLKAIWRRDELYHDPALTSRPVNPSNNLCQDFVKTLPTGTWRYLDNCYQLYWNEQLVQLSRTELAILLTLLNQPSHILSREQILNQISDYPEHRLTRTIDSHVKSLRQKLADIYPNIEVIVTHRGLGYGLNDQV